MFSTQCKGGCHDFGWSSPTPISYVAVKVTPPPPRQEFQTSASAKDWQMLEDPVAWDPGELLPIRADNTDLQGAVVAQYQVGSYGHSIGSPHHTDFPAGRVLNLPHQLSKGKGHIT